MPGNPQLGTLTNAIGIDCTQLNIADPNGVLSNLIIAQADPFELSAQFILGGNFALWIVGLAVPFTVTYFVDQFGGLNDRQIAAVSGSTVAGQLTYNNAATRATIPGNTLTPGTYKPTVVVSFGGNPPMTAFCEGPVIQIF